MKLVKRFVRLVPALLCCIMLCGCGAHWNYYTTIKVIDNDYFKTKIVHEDSECMIIENEITGEYFLVVAGNYGVSITPIEMSEMIVNYDEDVDTSSSMSDGAEGN